MSLSTSSSDAANKIRFPWAAVLSVIILISIEAVLHLWISFDPWEFAGDFRSDVIKENLDKAKARDTYKVILTGSSVADRYSAAEFEKLIPQSACAKMPIWSATPKTINRFIQHMMLPHTEPEIIVYVLNPRDVSDEDSVTKINDIVPDLEMYIESPMRYNMWITLQQNLFLYRYRSVIGDSPRKLVKQIGNRDNNDRVTDKEQTTGKYYSSFSPNLEAELQLMEIDKFLKDIGCILVIALQPVAPESSMVSEQYYFEQKKWFSEFQLKCIKSDILFIDLSPLLTEENLYDDPVHLNRKAGKKASIYITGELSRIGVL